MIDTHCHLNDERFNEDLEDVIKRALDVGVRRIVVVGYDVDSSEKAVELSEKYDFIYASVGLHPYEAERFSQRELYRIEELAKNRKVVVIGEIGLDYKFDQRERQFELFQAQLDLAESIKKTVILHVRYAFWDVFNMVKDRRNSFVFHSFSFGKNEMELIKYHTNMFVSFSGMITFLKEVQEAASISPRDRTLVETDSPYLAPEPLRGKRNEPANVKLVLERLCQIWNVDFKDGERITEENVRRLMGI